MTTARIKTRENEPAQSAGRQVEHQV